jgi:hypothetical protein
VVDVIAAGRQFVGIDLQLHRSVVARIDDLGCEVDTVRIDNDPTVLVAEVMKAGRGAKNWPIRSRPDTSELQPDTCSQQATWPRPDSAGAVHPRPTS